MYKCTKCGFRTADKATFERHLEACYGTCRRAHVEPRSPWWFHSPLRAAVIAALTTWSIIAIIIVAHAAPQSSFSAQVVDAATGGGVLGAVVTATPADGALALIALQTDAEGMAQFGELATGDWLITACGQTIVYASTADGDTAAIWLVQCNRLWLPVI